MNIKTLGQIFTPQDVVTFMLSLRQNKGSVMEPSCGDGAFAFHIKDVFAVEYDSNVCPSYACNDNFFSISTMAKFDTIIGNPPYIRYRDIDESTKGSLPFYSTSKTNLYIHFIKKCIHHLEHNGEIIFITPRDFLKATSAANINKFLFANGDITHWIDMGDINVFQGANPEVAIWRYQKWCYNRSTSVYVATERSFTSVNANDLPYKQKTFSCVNGILYFTNSKSTLTLGDIVDIKVGAVSGADDVFECHYEHEYAVPFVCSETRSTGNVRYMIYDREAPCEALHAHKERLLGRGIKKFNEGNWRGWGRTCEVNNKPRLYVNCKTRQKAPFFTHICPHWEGSVLALFPHNQYIDVDELATMLNNEIDWHDLGFMCNNRYMFGQRSLLNAPLSDSFYKFVNKG